MCIAETPASEPGAEKPAQQQERPVEAIEYPLEEDRSSLEPPGQETYKYKHYWKPIVYIPRAKALHIVEITT
ncbi:hypothetical protein GBF38_014548 [Nibea albiflora]|uniref:Uncharacterized protein n=1 Tax=Nibea albiflora TaxID=240163 RepID=A0ACB7F6X7_NIBAL|nr:hypothetical protein GBF38_014548 [Nibea albiflora]